MLVAGFGRLLVRYMHSLAALLYIAVDFGSWVVVTDKGGKTADSKVKLYVKDVNERPTATGFVASLDENKMRETMDNLSKRAYKQLEVLMSFFAIGGNFDKEVLLSDVLKKADATSAAAQALVNKGILTICERRVSRLKKFEATTGADSITFTPAQEKAINSIREHVLISAEITTVRESIRWQKY